MVDRIVLDASAVLAALLLEPGGDTVVNLLKTPSRFTAMSSVNYAEVVAKLVRDGAEEDQVAVLMDPFNSFVYPFSASQAIASGLLIKHTASLGLSLGDRACLSLAMELNAKVLTTDHIWMRLQLPLEIELLR
jgi:ribonuclease VapC